MRNSIDPRILKTENGARESITPCVFAVFDALQIILSRAAASEPIELKRALEKAFAERRDECLKSLEDAGLFDEFAAMSAEDMRRETESAIRCFFEVFEFAAERADSMAALAKPEGNA
ncbi:MAG TPA: hypothetical protein VIF88_12090 [Methylocystis sp.]|jgi:hypothetical protein